MLSLLRVLNDYEHTNIEWLWTYHEERGALENEGYVHSDCTRPDSDFQENSAQCVSASSQYSQGKYRAKNKSAQEPASLSFTSYVKEYTCSMCS